MLTFFARSAVVIPLLRNSSVDPKQLTYPIGSEETREVSDVWETSFASPLISGLLVFLAPIPQHHPQNCESGAFDLLF